VSIHCAESPSYGWQQMIRRQSKPANEPQAQHRRYPIPRSALTGFEQHTDEAQAVHWEKNRMQ
jgi:hypothetical protein